MSARIFFASAGGLTALIYSVTHVTMWSLNVPLITWWRRSGDKSSWISARGNPYVKGCGYNFNSKFRKNKETHHYIRNYSIVIPKRVFPHRIKKCLSMSVSSSSSITMIKIFPVCITSKNLRHQNWNFIIQIIIRTVDTTLARYKQVGLAPDSRRYMAPTHKWFNGSVHHHSKRLWASPCKVV